MAEQEVPGTCPSTKTTTELSKMSQATVWNFGSNRTLAVFGENLMKTMVNFSKSWLNSTFTLSWLPSATSSLVAGICQALKHSSCSLLVSWWAMRILSSSNEGCEFWLLVAAFDYCGHDRRGQPLFHSTMGWSCSPDIGGFKRQNSPFPHPWESDFWRILWLGLWLSSETNEEKV